MTHEEINRLAVEKADELNYKNEDWYAFVLGFTKGAECALPPVVVSEAELPNQRKIRPKGLKCSCCGKPIMKHQPIYGDCCDEGADGDL